MLDSRIKWKTKIKRDFSPSWICPYCKHGTLLNDTQSFHAFEDPRSKEEQTNDDWEPGYIYGVFGGQLACNSQSCKGIVFISGTMGYEEIADFSEYGEYLGENWEERLSPTFFNPPLEIFPINNDVPPLIGTTILESFQLFWIDTSSCSNKLRTCVELIMNDLKIPKSYTEKKIRKSYTLHQRIEIFKSIKSEEAELLMSIKWIGNFGSHTGSQLTKDDLLDAYEIFEHVLIRLYETQSVKIKKLSKEINKRRKPINGKKREILNK